MGTLVDAYVDLLIKQYWDKPKARADIEALATGWETLRDHIESWRTEFDVDEADGDRLDKIGEIVGMPRRIPYVIPKAFFGFAENPISGGFDDLFNPLPGLPPFFDLFAQAYETLELEDTLYQLFIKIKIAKNSALPWLAASDDGTSIQEAVNIAFQGAAYVVDNKDMSMTLYMSPSVDTNTLAVIVALDLLPRPQGVYYEFIIQSFFGQAFGFDSNPNALGFSDLFDPSRVGGKLSRLVI